MCPQDSMSQTVTDIVLPQPQKDGGKPLMDCMAERKSNREYASKEISNQELSNLLWAANGINREKDGKNTAPTANNRQNMEVYVVLPGGVYFYDSKGNILKFIKSGNYMTNTGKQDFVEKASVNLIIVSDMGKLGDATPDNQLLYAGIHSGAIMQNIYLYCASRGLNTVTRRYFDEKEVTEVLGLPAGKRPILAQSVGYPVE